MDDLRETVCLICDWTDLHLEKFRPSPREGLNSFTHVKPLAELALILYSFSKPSLQAPPFLKDWITRTGNFLREAAEDFGSAISWRDVPAAISQKPETGSILLIYPALRTITGRPTSWDQQVVTAFLQSDPSKSDECPALAFAQDLAGIGNCSLRSASLMIESLDAHQYRDLSYSEMYLLTHYIFFATKMGHRDLHLPAEQKTFLEHFLAKALQLNTERRNPDLVSEILICMSMMDCTGHPDFACGLKSLSAEVIRSGFAACRDHGVDDIPTFKQKYHTNLVALAALGHSLYSTVYGKRFAAAQ